MRKLVDRHLCPIIQVGAPAPRPVQEDMSCRKTPLRLSSPPSTLEPRTGGSPKPPPSWRRPASSATAPSAPSSPAPSPSARTPTSTTPRAASTCGRLLRGRRPTRLLPWLSLRTAMSRTRTTRSPRAAASSGRSRRVSTTPGTRRACAPSVPRPPPPAPADGSRSFDHTHHYKRKEA